MIERYVYLRLKPEFQTPEARVEVAVRTRSALANLPGVRGVRVGVPADEHSAAGWDLSITVRFDRLEDVAVYLADPEHRAFVEDYLAPKKQISKAWNFEIGEA